MLKQKQEKNRKRPIMMAFRVSLDEYAMLKQLMLLSGKTKTDFILSACLKQKVQVIGGKFASDRLAHEIKLLKEALVEKSVPTELMELLAECKELVAKLISLLSKQQH